MIDPYSPDTWVLIFKDSKEIILKDNSSILKQKILNFENTIIDIDHDEKGKRKYLHLNNI